MIIAKRNERHLSKIDKDGRRHYTIRAIPYQDPERDRAAEESARGAGQDRPQGLMATRV
jgi:hypothetical protein